MKLRLTAKILRTADSRVYDYQPGRNEVPYSDRLPFDILKLIRAGVVFVTPLMDTNPKSRTYKEWLNSGYHLITLYNIKHCAKNCWMLEAITKKADPTPLHRKDFARNLYDGKYNQILWGLEKKNIKPETMRYQPKS